MQLNQRLVDCATVLQNKQLLAKLRSCGCNNTEMNHYMSCLSCIEREQRRDAEAESSCTQEETIMTETAFAELVKYIFETEQNYEESVVVR